MKKLKELSPFILSASRIVMSPLIILLGIIGSKVALPLLIAFGVATDYLDGKLARIWNIKNKFSFSLDSVSDKIFIFATTIAIILTNPLALIPLPLELAIGTVNTISQLKGYKPKANKYGHIKQPLLYLTYFFYSLPFANNIVKLLSIILTFLTVSTQSLALTRYIRKYIESSQNVQPTITNIEGKGKEKEQEKKNPRKYEHEIQQLQQLKNNIIYNPNEFKDKVKVKTYKLPH